MSIRQPTRLLSLLLCLAFGSALLFGCGSEGSGNPPSLGSNPVTTDDGTGTGGGDGGGTSESGTLAIAVSRSSITAGDAGTTVTATVTDAAGAPAADEAVTFTASPASTATLSASSAVTDAAGQARVTLTGLRSGTATVTARHGTDLATTTVTVAGPRISGSVAPAGGDIVASNTSGPGAVVTFTVTDQAGTPLSGKTVSFSSTLGSLDASSRTTDVDGRAQVKVTSQAAGQALVTGSVLGVTSDAVQVNVVAGPLASLQLTPAQSQISPSGETAIEIVAKDSFGNPVDGTVTLVASSGTLTPSSVELAGGRGSSTLSPASIDVVDITATMDGVADVTGSTRVVVTVDLAGEPANILVAVTPVDGIITVAGVGGNEVAALDINVVDNAGDPIDDGAGVGNNLELVILDGPGGGENFDGRVAGQVLTLTTTNGHASASFKSGTLPGTVRIQVRVTKKKDGSALTPALTAVVPQITIEAGPPSHIFLSRSNAIVDNGDGTLTHEYFAVVGDLYGNPVPDNTAVFFGQFVNIKVECRQAGQVPCSDGSVTQGESTFTSPSGQFVTRGVTPGDTLAILNGSSSGGYIVANVVNETTLEVQERIFDTTETGVLKYAVGNNIKNLGGLAISPGGQSSTVAGVARWEDTYAGELVNLPVYLYAETDGRGLGHARLFNLAWTADTQLEVLGPEEVAIGADAVFTVLATDNSSPSPYAIPDLPLSVTATVGSVNDSGVGPVSLTTSSRNFEEGLSGGAAAFTWSAVDIPVGVTNATIFLAGGGVVVEIPLTIR